MTEKFNSGMGGYTCDNVSCSKLLWAGARAAERPDKRRYIYSTLSQNVRRREINGQVFYFCSEACAQEHRRSAYDRQLEEAQ